MQVRRTSRGIVVSLGGRWEDRDLDVMERVLNDLVEGQGNRAVIVDADGVQGEERAIRRVLVRVADAARTQRVRFAVDDGSAS